MNVIPLAQYLSEFEDGDVNPFRPRSAARPAKLSQPVFEHLTLVQDRAPDKKCEAVVEMPAPEPVADQGKGLEEAIKAAFSSLGIPDTPSYEAAFSEGRAAMKAELEAAHAEAIRDERERAAKDRASALEAARAEWVKAESGNLSAEFNTGLEQMERAIRTTLTSVLRPLASDARQKQTLTQLAESVRAMMFDGKAFTVRASGPEDLLFAFSEKLGPRRDLVTFEADEGLGEVRIEADRTVIETRLSSWRAALEEALA